MLLFKVVATELKRFARQRVTHIVAVLFLIITMMSVISGMARYHATQQERTAAASESDRQWNVQPDRHPHRVVHFGDYAIKPVSALSQFDWGVESYTGHIIFLEGHRQNSANFNEASQSTSLLRFGQFSPAFIVQVLLPLCLVFLGFSCVAGERETGLLNQLQASGMNAWAYLFGKWFSMILIGIIALLPVCAVAVYAGVADSGLISRTLVLLLSYLTYLVIWAGVIVLVSNYSKTAYISLLILVGLWMMWCIALPRVVAGVAEQRFISPTYVESEMQAEIDLKKIGDSHNPDDPYFNEFRAKTLQKYKVEKVEDLPFNYNGLLMQEGERLTTKVYQDQRDLLLQTHAQQNDWLRQFALINPFTALASVSRSMAGTDYAHHQDFLQQSEQRRYLMIQELNQLHTNDIKHADDRMQKLSAQRWQDISRGEYQLPSFSSAFQLADNAFFSLMIWMTGIWFLIGLSAVRMERR